MEPLKYVRRVILPFTFESSFCSKNPQFTSLVKYAKEKGIKLEEPPKHKHFRDCDWNTSRAQKIIIIPLDKSGKLHVYEPDWAPLFIFAYYLGRFPVKRLKRGICRPIDPWGSESSNKKQAAINREKELICYAEERIAFANGVEIIRSLNLFDFSDAVKGAEIVAWAYDYLLQKCHICRIVIERDHCPLLSKDLEVWPRMRTAVFDEANRIYDSLTGRKDSWKEMI